MEVKLPEHSLGNNKFDSLIDFVKFTHLVQNVERVVLASGQERWENDSEHSFQLAFVAWYLVEHEKLNLNIEKVLCLSLAHDVLEAYAGDTFIYGTPEVLATKEAREKEAILKIKGNFPDFTWLHQAIEEYETRKTPESRFVYVLDKLIPIFNIYLDDGRTWKREGITLEKIMEAKTDKIALAPELVPYYEEIINVLKNNGQLFS